MYKDYNFQNKKPRRPSLEIVEANAPSRIIAAKTIPEQTTSITVLDKIKTVPRAPIKYLSDSEETLLEKSAKEKSAKLLDLVTQASSIVEKVNKNGGCGALTPTQRNEYITTLDGIRTMAQVIGAGSQIDNILKSINCVYPTTQNGELPEPINPATNSTTSSSKKYIYAGLGGASVGTAAFLMTKKPVVSVLVGAVAAGGIYYLQNKQAQEVLV